MDVTSMAARFGCLFFHKFLGIISNFIKFIEGGETWS